MNPGTLTCPPHDPGLSSGLIMYCSVQGDDIVLLYVNNVFMVPNIYGSVTLHLPLSE